LSGVANLFAIKSWNPTLIKIPDSHVLGLANLFAAKR
jgi:hypothetical protein